MKLTSSYILCLSVLLLYAQFSDSKRGGGGGGFKISSKSHHSKSNTGYKKKDTRPQEKYPKQPVYNNNPPQFGGGGYPRQQYPGGRFGGSYGSYPSIQINPKNKILSPHYTGSFGYGGYMTQGSSPFYNQVRGMSPDARSRGFGRKAAMAAAGGTMAGMALGYGLGRFPPPHFQVRNRQEEYHYNHYMHRKSKERSSDSKHNDKDHFRTPQQDYSRYMDSCMKRNDLFPAEKPKPAVTNQTAVKMTNRSAVESSSSPGSPPPLNPQANLAPKSVQPINSAEEDADTVSIMEIGYPALIQQVKARRCLEMYMSLESAGGSTALGTRVQAVSAVLLAMMLAAVNSKALKLLP
ncbi:hypothetical protein FQA47_011990 [Oryzias melastigma]|uniref:Uncharacterized LOC112148310 n=1 Tax=Oryzias melastigma TaxID=30732 RepID=A0A3B3DR75_ORYME|nr:prion protein b [Oryzias melastigma]XP_024131085.1 prion protein b [Oryzias melastigma]KAF6730058.1 hypothetical protein FQA47_011990 [Oryzias melastigma]